MTDGEEGHSGGHCQECGATIHTPKQAKRHWRREHMGDTDRLDTPEEELPDTITEQRDFEGEEPSEEDHNPVYEYHNDPEDTEDSSLFEYYPDQ